MLYTLGPQLRNIDTDFTLGNCLFGSVKVTKNADLDKSKFTGYSVGCDYCLEFFFTDGGYEKISLFLELMWAHLCILIMREKIP